MCSLICLLADCCRLVSNHATSPIRKITKRSQKSHKNHKITAETDLLLLLLLPLFSAPLVALGLLGLSQPPLCSKSPQPSYALSNSVFPSPPAGGKQAIGVRATHGSRKLGGFTGGFTGRFSHSFLPVWMSVLGGGLRGGRRWRRGRRGRLRRFAGWACQSSVASIQRFSANLRTAFPEQEMGFGTNRELIVSKAWGNSRANTQSQSLPRAAGIS